jgi:hypoxanthine phosphoribosyltransferase
MPEILITREALAVRVIELAAAIERDTAGPGPPHCIAVLKGAFVFLADLLRAFKGPVTCDFLGVSSYRGTTASGEVRVTQDLERAIHGRDVVLVEDIVDTGRTLAYLQSLLLAREPRSLRTVCLLDKPSRRQVPVHVDYTGFEIGDRFVVGYGLDLDEHYRNLPYIGTLERVGHPPTARTHA